MNFDSLRCAGWLVPVLLLSTAPSVAQETGETQDPEAVVEKEAAAEEQAEITTASPEVVESLLGAYESAEESEDAEEIAEALGAMSAHDNEEFGKPAQTSLEYRASGLDKKAARQLAEELDMLSKDEIQAFVVEREVGVQEAAARVLANLPGKGSTRALAKAFKDKKIRKGKPKVIAAVVHAMGELGYDRAEKDVFKQMGLSSDEAVIRACVRYLGQIKTKEFSYVRTLVEMLEPPEPLDVSKNTLPASYWATRWERWRWTRLDVTWSLKEITGQTFQSRNGEDPSDADKALRYIKEHKKELRLR